MSWFLRSLLQFLGHKIKPDIQTAEPDQFTNYSIVTKRCLVSLFPSTFGMESYPSEPAQAFKFRTQLISWQFKGLNYFTFSRNSKVVSSFQHFTIVFRPWTFLIDFSCLCHKRREIQLIFFSFLSLLRTPPPASIYVYPSIYTPSTESGVKSLIKKILSLALLYSLRNKKREKIKSGRRTFIRIAWMSHLKFN